MTTLYDSPSQGGLGLASPTASPGTNPAFQSGVAGTTKPDSTLGLPNYNLGVNPPPLTAAFGTPDQGNRTAGIITSKPAEDHIANLKATSDQATADMANHQNFVGQQNQQTSQTQQQQNQQDIENQQNQQKTNATTADSMTQLLNELTGVENTLAKPNALQSDVINNNPQEIDLMKQQLQTVSDSLKQMSLGTHPLTAPQQAQVNALADQAASAFRDAQDLGQSQVNGQTMLNAISKIQMYSPQEAQANIAAIIQNTSKNIAAINVKLINAQADLTQALQDENYKYATQLYNDISEGIKDKTQELTDANKAVADATQQMHQDAKDNATLQLQALMDDHTISYQDKQNALANAQLDETTRHNMETELTAREVALKGTYNRDTDGTIYNTSTGEVVSGPNDSLPIGTVTPGNTGNPLVDANTKYTGSGVPYVDGSNLTGADASKAQLVAAKMGIPYMGKTGADALNNLDAARNDFKLISDYVNKLNPSISMAGLWRLAVTTVHGAENVTQSGPGATDLSSFNVFKQSAIKAIQALASGGTGLRINQAEIETMLQSIPSYNDTKGVAQSKLLKLNSLLTNNEKSLIGGKYFDAYSPTEATKDVDKYEALLPQNKAQVEAILKANPTLTDGQIMQLVQP